LSIVNFQLPIEEPGTRWDFESTIDNWKSTIIPGMTSTEKAAEARRFVVRGRVQGVGFRWFVEREAHILGIAGWVRNNADGSVEILAQGTRDQLSGLRSRLREGPRAARVDAVEESEARPAAELSSFRIEGAW
jgi:acylphosphatase